MRNSNKDPTAYSQERQQDDTQSSSTRKLGRSGESASSASTRKLERGDDIQIGKPKMEFHNMQISDHRYLEKVFKNLRKKLNLAEEAPVIGIEALKTNLLLKRLFLSTTIKSTFHLKPNCTFLKKKKQKHKLRGTPEVIRYRAEINNGPSSRNSECTSD